MVAVPAFTVSTQLEWAVLHTVAVAFALSVDSTALGHAMCPDAHQDSHVCCCSHGWQAADMSPCYRADTSVVIANVLSCMQLAAAAMLMACSLCGSSGITAYHHLVRSASRQ